MNSANSGNIKELTVSAILLNMRNTQNNKFTGLDWICGGSKFIHLFRPQIVHDNNHMCDNCNVNKVISLWCN